MDIKPFLHEHYLQHDEYYKENASCHKCHGQIHGWAYNCESCPDFWLHRPCARQQLPPQISHPLHRHSLTLSYGRWVFICRRCFRLSRGHNYRCRVCNFLLDVPCAAASTNDAKLPNLKIKRLSEGLVGIPHFVHEHQFLGVFNYRKVGKRHYKCGWCEKHLSGMIYGCFPCGEGFYFHESCLSKIPTKLFGHPFHSSHPLYILPSTLVNNSRPRCNACKAQIVETAAYACRKCDFNLHALCSTIQPSLKHEIHQHTLTYFQIKPSASRVAFSCKICDGNICDAERGENNFYRCVQCDFSFHFKCLEIPLSITHRYHRHTLTLIEHFEEDDSGKYYCDICEEKRNAKHNVYGCENCTFISHIQCALNKIPKLKEKEVIEKRHAESESNDFERQIEHFIHGHPLSYYEKIDQKSEDVLCKACNMEIYGKAYGCESCKYYLHNQCTKLPYEVLHPLHPQHPLQLFDQNSNNFFCDECSDTLVGFGYICYLCSFIIDVKCVTLTTKSSNDGQRLKEMSREPKLCPLQQDHELSFFNVRSKEWPCNICSLQVSGFSYTCPLCVYIVHESCLGFLREMALPFHPEHPLHPIVYYGSETSCRACSFPIPKRSICYNCEQSGDIKLHLSCANALWRATRSKSHPHPLFYFGTECQNVFASVLFKVVEEMKCVKCNKPFGGVHFYRCIYCDVNFHLECVPIPHFIESKCHIHPLTLRDCFIEDESGEYYCDVCEEERHPKDHVYFCEECQGLFVTHIECMLRNVVEEIAPAQEPSQSLVLDFDKVPLRTRNRKQQSDSGN